MKTFTAFLSLFLVLPAFAGTEYKVDPSASKVAWVGKKITGQHNGTLALKSGKFEFDGDTLKGGEFSVDMTTLKVLDLADPKYNSDLTSHLKSDDFFSVDKFHEATFTVKSVKKNTEGLLEATGPLKIKDIEKTITVPLKVTKNGDLVEVSGKASLDRTLWNIKFRSGKFFEKLGDKLIYDKFDIEVDLKGKKS